MKKIFSILSGLVATVIVLGVAFGAGLLVGKYYFGKPQAENAHKKNGFDLELPFVNEKRVVTVEEVEAKLYEIGELCTYSGEYSCTLAKDETRYLLDKMPIPGTTNSIEIDCKGIVKVGFNLSDINVKVGNDKIYVSIPEAKVKDNYVIWDSVTCNESNSILNPIEFPQYQEIIEEIERKGLAEVENDGIYSKAEKHLRILIKAFLGEFSDYEVVFM